MDVSKISKLDCRQLRAELKEVGLSQAGKKADLQQRLLDHFNIDTRRKSRVQVQSFPDEEISEHQSEQKAQLAALELEIEILKKQQELVNLKNGISQPSEITGAGLKEAMVDAVYASHVQVVEPMVFDGDPLKYTVWKIQLESLVESPQIKKRDRLNILTKYVKDKALSVIQHLVYVKDDGCFEKAMSLLDQRFGDSYKISEAFRSKLEHWPTVKAYDNDALYELSDFVQQCLQVKQHVPGLSILDDGRENQKLLRHLPTWFITKWREKIVEYKAQHNQKYPTFEVFAEFLHKRAEINSEPITSVLFNAGSKNQSQQKKPEKPNTSLSTHSYNDDNKGQANSSANNQKNAQCSFCANSDHRISACSKFMEKPWSERHEFVKTKRLCFACLLYGHPASKCRKRHTCGKCKKSHPTCLHRDTVQDTDTGSSGESNDNSQTFAHAINSVDVSHSISDADKTRILDIDNRENFYTTIVPVWVSSKENPSHEILVYALLDNMSNKCFVLSDVYDQLDTDYFDTTLKLGTMASRCTKVATKGSLDLQIRSYYDSSKVIPLPPTYTRDFIPADESSIPNPKSIAKWPHLSHIASQIPERVECPIGLLLSHKCLRAFLPREYIAGGDNEPFAVKTDLGWLIMGPENDYYKDCDKIGMTHCVMTLPKVDDCVESRFESQNPVKFKCTQPIKESFSQQILKVLESDFKDSPSEQVFSQNDVKFMALMKDGISQDTETKHYRMPLPFKDNHDKLPNNRTVVMNRLSLLRQKLCKDKDYKDQYFKFMNAMIDSGEAELVTSQTNPEGRTWYIPHFGVTHAKKNKLRVVFDCSSKHQGVSLNDCLLSGPDHINSLVGILMRFRLNNVALTCDIEKMFYQFDVHENQRDFLRFLWFADDSMSEVVDYRMTVHLFGATSSPACATYGLRTIASNHHDPSNESSVLAKQFITHDFYVDDGICSVSDVKTACELANNARSICREGGVRLHKFLSSSVDVMKSIPASECAASVQCLDLNDASLPVERTLGIAWSVENDEFQFSVNVRHGKHTRRTLLSTVASVYDPLGWLAPFVLKGKQILQRLCQAKLSWDDELPPEFKIPWESWLLELQKITDIRIPRQYWPGVNPYSDLKSVELHHFSDASETGYGQCSYLRMISQANKVKCALIMGKARVTPKKVVTIPRLELQAAVVSVKIAQRVGSEISNNDLRQYFWTDSTAVLGYITNEDKQYHTYVGNRVQTIRNYTDPSQWHYVKSKSNPADTASRTCNVSDLSHSWLNGPDFLYDSELDLDTCRHPKYQIAADDPEVKCVVNSVVSVDDVQPPFGLYDRLQGISEWDRMLALVGLFKTKAWSVQNNGQPLDKVECKHKSVQYIIKELQHECFPNELAILESESKRQLPKASPLYGLNPFLDCDGIIRVGGRCSRARWEFSEKHPMILPRKSHITDVLTRFYHAQYAHQGRSMTVNAIRSHGFWIIGISRVVSRIIHYCVTCRKERGALSSQKMADLPTQRVEESPPFTSVGCDCFGPFIVNENRKQLKKYGVLYTCLYSRAVHIEILDDLSTDSFINSFRQVTSVRGNIRKLFCDRGTNFVGASSDFKQAFDSMTDSELKSKLAKLGCEFVFNPPSASHMGGVWERQIRSIRSILTNLINKHPCRVNSSELRTLFCETMAVINSRPLSVENLYDPHSPRPLTPNHLLTMKSEVVVPPPGQFSDTDLYTRKRWKKVQFLANQFWKEWKRQYLVTLQNRSKWTQIKPNIQVDSVVVISDENCPRNMWKLGRVVEVFKGDDGLVRKVRLFTGVVGGRAHYLERPIHKLVVLLD